LESKTYRLNTRVLRPSLPTFSLSSFSFSRMTVLASSSLMVVVGGTTEQNTETQR
jgi:hypothetical protein